MGLSGSRQSDRLLRVEYQLQLSGQGSTAQDCCQALYLASIEVSADERMLRANFLDDARSTEYVIVQDYGQA